MKQTPVTTLSGIGEQTAARLKKLGIETIEDMVSHYPREYEDRRNITPIQEIVLEEDHNIVGTVVSTPTIMKKAGKIIVEFRIKDETGSIFVVFFNQAYMKNTFQLGDTYNFYGKVKRQYKKIQMESPEYQKVASKEEAITLAKIIPIYHSTYKLSQKIIRSLIQKALEKIQPYIEENLPETIKSKYELVDKKTALMNIHFPESNEAFFKARKRLVFEELFVLQVSLRMLKEEFGQKKQGVSKALPHDFMSFIKSLPFELTGAQKEVIKEIIKDLKSPYAGNRLIQGDVGSGKTVVAAIALFVVARGGMQGVLMAPTEVLARQHFESLKGLYEPFGISVALLTGSTTAKQKRLLVEELEKGDIDIVIGTHALLEDPIAFYNLGLVITDEQHRFGVRQRMKLSDKGASPDVLVMTATPIPRTLALILYGDMDISLITSLPPGRIPIKTNAVDSAYQSRIYAFIREHVTKGRQCYIICPMVEEDEKQNELKAVTQYTKQLQEEVFKEFCVEYLHGKMKSKEKNEVMERFAQGEINILVSTTVVEVGVNVPNATIILIQNAERFGLAQLHQLRGRVGRGTHKSYCILISDSKNKITKERLKIMEKSTDGFVIADMDLKLRGPGEFFGTRQHGLPEMKIANLYSDGEMLKQAQEAAEWIFAGNTILTKDEKEKLTKSIEEKMKKEELHHAL
jgi:ATP-dependent DNA helicase RecG